PVPLPRVERNEVGVRLRECRVDLERRLVSRDRAIEIVRGGELEASLQQCGRVVPERSDAVQDRIRHRGPPRAEPRVLGERGLCLLPTSERAIRERERVVSGAELRKERDCALQMPYGRVVMPFRRIDAAETE